MVRTKRPTKKNVYTEIADTLRRKNFGNPTAELEPCSLSGLIDRAVYACMSPQTCLMKYLDLIQTDAAHARMCLDRVDAAVAQLKKLKKTEKRTPKRGTK